MRKHYIDNIRWGTIVLVVFYHVIYMYNGITVGVMGPFKEVQYQDCLQYLLYPWFMLLLFVISGMSSRFYLESHSEMEYIKSRTRKLLVPGTLGILVFGWIQGYYNMLIGGAFDTKELSSLPKPALFFIMAFSGTGVLWFIQMLWLLSLLLIVVRKLEKDRLYTMGNKCGIIALLLFTFLIYLSAQILNTPVIAVYRFGIYATGFFIGYFVLSHDEVIERLSKHWIFLSLAAVVLGITYTVLYFGENYAVAPTVNCPLACIYAWIMTLAILAFMKLHGDRETWLTKWMNKKSWGLYVFHYLPLSMTAWYLHLYAAKMPAVCCYLLCALSSFAAGILIFEIIRRIPILRWCVLGLKKEEWAKRPLV